MRNKVKLSIAAIVMLAIPGVLNAHSHHSRHYNHRNHHDHHSFTNSYGYNHHHFGGLFRGGYSSFGRGAFLGYPGFFSYPGNYPYNSYDDNYRYDYGHYTDRFSDRFSYDDSRRYYGAYPSYNDFPSGVVSTAYPQEGCERLDFNGCQFYGNACKWSPVNYQCTIR